MRFGFTAPLSRREGCDVSSYSAPGINLGTEGGGNSSGSSSNSSGISSSVSPIIYVRVIATGEYRDTTLGALREVLI